MSKKHDPMRGIRKLLNRRLFIALLIIAQIAFIIIMLFRTYHTKWLGTLLTLFSVITALHLLTRPDKSAYKISLVFLILLFPVFGGAFYWIFHFETASSGYRRTLARIEKDSEDAFAAANTENGIPYCEAVKQLPAAKKQLEYLNRFTPFPVYRNTKTKYYGDGREMLEQMLVDLKGAKKYIFLEYFIIGTGVMWDSILEILRQKVKEGVTVRVMYDDLGCILTLPPSYRKTLRSYGIECCVFNKFRPFLTCLQNNRDHRKICVVDGEIAYTGGINLADEYIGVKIKHGIWKDCAIRLSGDGAWGFTVMFLQMWSFANGQKVDYDDYRPERCVHPEPTSGWVQPYSDGPMNRENVAEHIYLRMIEQSQQYLYITTPYLMVDDGMLSALKLAAKSGVDVRIITPEVPDKKTVLFTTRSYYRPLIEAGVKIYEFRDGFMHAKTFLSDDSVATVGTVNLDFRSLYLHFECGTCLYGTSSVAELKQDFLRTLENSRQITPKDCKANGLMRMLQSICRIFAPLM